VDNPLNEHELEAAILGAHETADAHRLTELYHVAANTKFATGDEVAGAFLLTHAYVFALESGHKIATELHKQLVKLGREEAKSD